MENKFLATEPSLGYYYQNLYALYESLRRGTESNEDFWVGVEVLDDISIVHSGGTDILQTKFSTRQDSRLSDRSRDFWKSIRVWAETLKAGKINSTKTRFFLVTTSTISKGSILDELGNDEPNYDAILSKLENVAAETENNASNREGYVSFIALEKSARLNLLKNIKIIDSSSNFSDLEQKIKQIFRATTRRNKIDSLSERLISWWFLEVIKALDSKRDRMIAYSEIQAKATDIRDHLTDENLPNDFPEAIEVDEERYKNFLEEPFVKQLFVVGISKRMVSSAISDYHRAYEQRSKWIRESLLNPSEENIYEKRLVDDWRPKFDLLLDDSENLGTLEKGPLGKDFYLNNYVKSCPSIHIRPYFTDYYLTRGSCHILSNSKKIGWHPEFSEII